MLRDSLIHVPAELQRNALQAVWMDGARTGFVVACVLLIVVYLWRTHK